MFQHMPGKAKKKKKANSTAKVGVDREGHVDYRWLNILEYATGYLLYSSRSSHLS